MALLCAHDWTGNVRALENVVVAARFMARSATIEPSDLPDRLGASTGRIDGSAAIAAGLHARVAGGESFWDVVHGPYLRREVSREDVRELVAHALRESGGTYKDVARLYRMEGQYKKFVNFIAHHGLGSEG